MNKLNKNGCRCQPTNIENDHHGGFGHKALLSVCIGSRKSTDRDTETKKNKILTDTGTVIVYTVL